MLKNKVIEQLKTVYDPEMPVDIYELGLIYDISFEDAFPMKKSTGKNCKILMTLTSAWCPEAQSIPLWVRDAALNVEEVVGCEVEVTFEPPWNQDCMSESAKLEIGVT